MRYSGNARSYLNVYIPKHIVDQFRMHCASRGLVMSSTVAILIEKYLEGKQNG